MTDDHVSDYHVFERFTVRWPEAGDQLLSPGRDSFLAEDAGERSYRMLQGYKRAGDILIQTALAERYDADNLIFPALFNYRHYIELALKAIIEEHGNFAGFSLGKERHKLRKLWELFVKIAAAFGDDCSDAAATAVATHINEFANVDADATAFRYARDVKGGVIALPGKGLDLINLRDVMNSIENFFEGYDQFFTHKAEAEAECGI